MKKRNQEGYTILQEKLQKLENDCLATKEKFVPNVKSKKKGNIEQRWKILCKKYA